MDVLACCFAVRIRTYRQDRVSDFAQLRCGRQGAAHGDEEAPELRHERDRIPGGGEILIDCQRHRRAQVI